MEPASVLQKENRFLTIGGTFIKRQDMLKHSLTLRASLFRLLRRSESQYYSVGWRQQAMTKILSLDGREKR